MTARIGYYVTVKRDERVGYLLGPFSMKKTADDLVEQTRALAYEVDPWCVFDAFGVTRVVAETLPKGKLNNLHALKEKESKR